MVEGQSVFYVLTFAQLPEARETEFWGWDFAFLGHHTVRATHARKQVRGVIIAVGVPSQFAMAIGVVSLSYLLLLCLPLLSEGRETRRPLRSVKAPAGQPDPVSRYISSPRFFIHIKKFCWK